MPDIQFDRNKMRAVILHVCHACSPDDLGAVKLHKVLYFLDMLSYAHHRQVVTGATYRKRPYGPASDQLLFQLREMERAGAIEINEVDYHGYQKREYRAKATEPEGVLSEMEVDLLDDIIDFVCRDNTAKSISEYSHKLPWQMADMGKEIPYHSALLLIPNEPTPEALDAASEGQREFEKARSDKNAVDMSLLSTFRESLLQSAGQR
ncbi:Panacea domain-containing protein [Alterisphingorhabdus coralli]|uniref:Panacea domain-containing protein n=1 Tax=Alterisphingorhabdus coralli TaxID=3071408 RepID=A0AA97I248_9SPHN|nr:Panacea domain-containing protein [Parasphingorhabdus sp. SCSIO 66989]WOE75410.1 Panacea domain-containing protein [Parasphingorhabdus sp. SCSIO 66989]